MESAQTPGSFAKIFGRLRLRIRHRGLYILEKEEVWLLSFADDVRTPQTSSLTPFQTILKDASGRTCEYSHLTKYTGDDHHQEKKRSTLESNATFPLCSFELSTFYRNMAVLDHCSSPQKSAAFRERPCARSMLDSIHAFFHLVRYNSSHINRMWPSRRFQRSRRSFPGRHGIESFSSMPPTRQ